MRRSLAAFAEQCEPHFTLARVFRGLPPRNAREAEGIDLERGRAAWLSLTTCRYMILLFRKAVVGGL